MPLRDGFFSTATQTSCCNRIQRSNRVRLLVVSTHDFPDNASETVMIRQQLDRKESHKEGGSSVNLRNLQVDDVLDGKLQRTEPRGSKVLGR